MKKQSFIIAAILLIFVACTKEYELQKSVFISDEIHHDLPAYSEWGYNTFGAYYDRQLFISNNEIVPAKIVVTNDTLSFILDGETGESYYSYHYYYDYTREMKLTFNFPGLTPEQYTDLIILNDTIFDLENPLYEVLISFDTVKYEADILSGELTLKKARNLLVDKRQTEVILSGYFEFKALVNNEPVTMSYGRFDVGISPDNFYNY